MKKLVIALMSLAIISCQTEESKTEGTGSNSIDNAELSKLKEENLDLKHQIMVKDSLYNYYASYMNDIKSNLDLIQGKQKTIFDKQANPEMLSAEDPNLIADIENLGKLLNDNKAKISKLKAEIKNNNTQMGAFEEMIITLSEEVEAKNMEVYQLQQELENVDAAFGELFVAFQEKSTDLENVTIALNTAYYSYGTKKELIANKVITTEGGVLGIGKNNELADDFNKDYFTEVNINDLTEIPLGFEKVEMTTNHPKSSYKLVEGSGSITKLVIKDPKAFWSISKYLVMVVK
jgi:DNA repair exonuclease SbcCD ATPase subunit